MTLDTAIIVLRHLRRGLSADIHGCAMLRERISTHDECEALTAALAELGARSLLDEADSATSTGNAYANRVRGAAERYMARQR